MPDRVLSGAMTDKTMSEGNRNWQPLQGGNFADLSFQEKVEALTAGTNNTMVKILTLLALDEKRPLTRSELYAETIKLYGDPPFSQVIPWGYCTKSLLPVGAVIKGTITKGNRTPKAFARAPEAEKSFFQ